MGLILGSPGNFSARSWKVLDFSRLWFWESDTVMQVQICGFLWTHKIDEAFSFRGLHPLAPTMQFLDNLFAIAQRQ